MIYSISIKAEGQALSCKSISLASDTVAEVECTFDLSAEWQAFDSVKAIFSDKFGTAYAVELADGSCMIPWEVLTHKGPVSVNLCAYELEDEETILRLTSYKTICVSILQEVNIDGENSAPPTPEEWEQDVARLEAELNGKLDDSPHDGKTYGRRDGEWTEVTGGGGGTAYVDGKILVFTGASTYVTGKELVIGA